MKKLREKAGPVSASCVMYRVNEIERVHNTCFHVTLERVGWPTGNKATLPSAVCLEFTKAGDVPMIGSSVWLEARTDD